MKTYLFNVIYFCMIFAFQYVLSQETCNTPFVSLANNCYYFSVPSENSSWVESREACLRIGGLLAILDSEEKNDAVGDYLTEHVAEIGPDFKWIALNDQAQEGRFVWDGTGAELTYSALGGLSHSDTSNCVMDAIQTFYNWTDYPCSAELQYICQQLPACSSDPVECNPPFTSLSTGCYNIYTESSAPWVNAHDYCNTFGSSLLSIDSEEESQVIYENLDPDNLYWMGAYDTSHEGDWYWDNSGYPMNYTNWQPGQPNGGEAENCALIYNGTWSDYPCDEAFYFVCEMPSNC